MMPREFHLYDFPDNKIFVHLNEDFRKKFFNKSIEIFENRRNLAKFLRINKLDTISRWRDGVVQRGKGWDTSQAIPLWVLLKLSKVLTDKGYLEFSIKNIEKHTSSYKARGGTANEIKNPVLPLKEDTRIVRILVHIMGDGCALTNNTNYFKNYDDAVLQEFANDLKVFGDVEYLVKPPIVFFPKAIGYVLSKIYRVRFGTFSGEIPKYLILMKNLLQMQ